MRMTSQNMTSQDRPFLGVLLMLGFCALAPFGDALGKILGAVLPIGMIVLVRFAAQIIILGPLAAVNGASLIPKPEHRRPIVLRTLLHIAGITMMFTSLRYLPLADAIAIAFVMPFLMLLLGWWFLDETVGPRRIIACGIGFCGTLMVIQPSFAAVGFAALLPLGVAVIFALFMLITRQIAKDVDPVALQATSGALAVAILLPVLLLGGWIGLSDVRIVPPDAWQVWLLIATGMIGSAAHLLMTWSLRFAPSATVAPMQYLEIPFATIIGFAIFQDLPNGLAALGIVVTMAAGLYIIFRERSAPQAPPQARPMAASPEPRDDL